MRTRPLILWAETNMSGGRLSDLVASAGKIFLYAKLIGEHCSLSRLSERPADDGCGNCCKDSEEPWPLTFSPELYPRPAVEGIECPDVESDIYRGMVQSRVCPCSSIS